MKNQWEKTTYERKEEIRRERIKKFNLTSDLFFGKVMEDKKACEEIITILLGKKFAVEEVTSQCSFRNLTNRSIVVDILAKDEEKGWANLEIQLKDNVNHVKRVRYLKEEREGVKYMCEILELEREEGKAEGIVLILKELNATTEQIVEQLIKQIDFSEVEARAFLKAMEQ